MRLTAVLGVAAGSTIAASVLAGGPDTDRAYAAELKADAAARTSALESAAGLAEGDSSVKLGGWFLFRYYMNFRDNPSSGSFHDSGFTNGFESYKTRLNATGHVMSKDLTFKVEGEFSKNDGSFSLTDAYVDYKYENGLSARAGQFKAPLLRQELVGDQFQLGAGRTLTDDIFSQKRSQGLMGTWKNESWQVRGAITDGINTQNTPYTSPAESDVAVTARVDYKSAGDWKVFDDFSSWQGSETAWLVGFAGHWQMQGNTASTGTPPQRNLFEYTADFSIEGNGWNAFAAIIGRHIDPGSGGGGTLDDFGGVIQGGVFVHKNAEIFGSWDATFPDSNYGSGLDSDFHTLTGGVNIYPFEKSSAVKFTGQVAWFLNNPSENALVNPTTTSNVQGLRPYNDDNQFALIFQMQVVF